jgi:hypothetical protein
MKKIIFIFALILVPKITNAEVYISEIMYDLEGTDSDREWVEVYNDTSENVDLSTYFLYESNVAHKITGSEVLDSNEYGIIVDSVEKFKIDWPDFTGKIFDSSFSLTNVGEELILLDANKNELDKVIYSPDQGAKGTGNSLQLFEEIFIPGAPTPGEENVTEPADENPNEPVDKSNSDENSNNSTHSGQNNVSDFSPSVKIKTGIGRDRVVSLNSPIEFEVYLSDNEKGKHFWNFGDNKKARGEKVEHFYKHIGEYNVVVNSYFETHANTSRIKVSVVNPELEITVDNNILEIKNIGNREINLGGFEIKINSETEKIIKDTIISQGQKLIFEHENMIEEYSVLYPNGKKYYSSVHEKAENFCSKLKA